jgi:uncharacterized membrane protein HdeD (DUF308 family)
VPGVSVRPQRAASVIDSPSVANKILAGAGIVLIILGIAALVHPEFTYDRHQEVLRVGPIQTVVEKENSVQVPAGVGILAISAGVVLTIFGFRKKI